MAGLMDKLKGAASAAKVKVDVVVDKAGEKMPPKVKQTYEKVSDKVEKVIPGKKDSDTDEQAAAAAAAAADPTAATAVGPTGEADAAHEAEVNASAAAEEAAAVAAEKAEGEADSTMP